MTPVKHSKAWRSTPCPQGGWRSAHGDGPVWQRVGMHWEQALLELFDELETQATGLSQQARDDDVADLARAEYAEVTLAERLHGSVGSTVTLHAAGGVTVRGRLERVGSGCAALTSSEVPRVLHLVNLTHVLSVLTTSPRAIAEASLPVTSRLGLASAVRHLAEDIGDTGDIGEVVVRLCDARRVAGQLVRVGADFVGLAPEGQQGEVLVPLAAVVTLAPA